MATLLRGRQPQLPDRRYRMHGWRTPFGLLRRKAGPRFSRRAAGARPPPGVVAMTGAIGETGEKSGASPPTYIFPLNTVLFPGGALPLKIFEQRYIELTKICISEERPFGVCLIKEGRETGTPAVPQDIGCLARIAHWDMPQLGVFHLQVEGLQRFRIVQSAVEKNGLITAAIEHLANDSEVAPEETLCSDVLKAIIEKVGAEHFPAPHRFDDAAWIG